MKKTVLMAITALTLALGNANAQNEWMTKYGMTPCDNPVFIAPMRTVQGGRVEGAGINMNDGEAYSSNYITFSTEWHYAPKIDLSTAEQKQWYRIAGDRKILLLKFSVKQINGCGAAVIYRDTQARRDEPNLGQILATFDADGNVIDIMTTGNFYDMEEVLEWGNTGSYENKPNMGSRNMKYTSDSTFTIFNYYYYTNTENGESAKWEEERDYLIDDEGKIHLTEVREKERPTSLDVVWTLREVSMAPSGDLKNTLNTLTDIKSKVAGNKQLNEWYNRILEQQIKRDIPQFLVWRYYHKNSDFDKKIDSIIMDGIDFEKDDLAGQVLAILDKIDNRTIRNYWKADFKKRFQFIK